MAHTPQLTVIMPVYNSERFLAAAIDSVLQQTFSDFELLIIDDGSTDRTQDILATYQDPRLRLYVNERNLGITPSLNKGLSLAQAPVVARMDADDICYPDRFIKQYAYLQQHPECMLVASWVQIISEEGQPLRQDDFKPPFYYYNLTFDCWIYHPSIMFRKEAVLAVGGYTQPYAEDHALFCQLSRQFHLWVLPEVLLEYRQSSQSLHQVLKQPEYETAQQNLVLHNIRYYVGEEVMIPNDVLACLRHHFDPLLQKGSVSSIVSCLRLLDRISLAIALKPNPNRDPSAIQEAALHKRNFILSFYARNLPPYKAVLLLIQTAEWSLLKRLSLENIKRKLKSKEDAC